MGIGCLRCHVGKTPPVAGQRAQRKGLEADRSKRGGFSNASEGQEHQL